LVPLTIFSEIETIKRELKRKIKKEEPFDADLLFLIDGAYHVLFSVAELCESKGIDLLDEAKARAEIPRALDLLKDLVKQESLRDEAFTASRFFKDAKTKSKIQRIITAGGTSRTTASRRRAGGRA
jgi:hypothetical protein